MGGGWGKQLRGEVGLGAQGRGACLSRGQGWASLASACPCRTLEELTQAHGSTLFPGREGVTMLLTVRMHTGPLPHPPRRKYLRRWHHETLLHRLQGSQQARRLAATWQHWVDAQGAEELARLLVSGVSHQFPISSCFNPDP